MSTLHRFVLHLIAPQQLKMEASIGLQICSMCSIHHICLVSPMGANNALHLSSQFPSSCMYNTQTHTQNITICLLVVGAECTGGIGDGEGRELCGTSDTSCNDITKHETLTAS